MKEKIALILGIRTVCSNPKNELEELTQIIKNGYNTIKPHEIANRKYPWDIKNKGN